jgi:hypothetical protein
MQILAARDGELRWRNAAVAAMLKMGATPSHMDIGQQNNAAVQLCKMPSLSEGRL